MSNTHASEDNTESPSTYGKNAYSEYRKKEKKQDDNDNPSEGKDDEK